MRRVGDRVLIDGPDAGTGATVRGDVLADPSNDVLVGVALAFLIDAICRLDSGVRFCDDRGNQKHKVP